MDYDADEFEEQEKDPPFQKDSDSDEDDDDSDDNDDGFDEIDPNELTDLLNETPNTNQIEVNKKNTTKRMKILKLKSKSTLNTKRTRIRTTMKKKL